MIEKLQGYTALLIDDDEDSRNLGKHILQAAGAQVLVARNGREGFAVAVKEQPDFILSDISMPGMDGLEMMREMAISIYTREIPVIALSGLDDPQTRLDSFRAGFLNYIQKPFDPDKLVSQVMAILSEYPKFSDFAGDG